jgi:hypothetical protein
MERIKAMDKETLLIKGYQPVKSSASDQKEGENILMNIIPPKGGTGETTLKRK